MRELVVDSFAGGGGASTGIEMALGYSVDIAVNHDLEAIAMHQANHPETRHFCESVWKVDPLVATEGRPVGLAWFSPDCFPAGTLVLAESGYVPIESIKVGDKVLTHKGHWRSVTETHSSEKPLYEIRGHGHPGLKVSPEHPFYAKHRNDKWINSIRQYRPEYSEADWVPASMLGKNWYWASPTKIESLSSPEMTRDHMAMTTLPLDERLMWLAGRYLGDGWTRLTDTRAELVIICGKHKAEELKLKLDMWPRSGFRVANGELSWNAREVRTAFQFTTNSRALVIWLRNNFGHGAAHKTVPGWMFGQNECLRRAFLEGYLSADGWEEKDSNGRDIVESVTVSPSLAYGIKTLANTFGYAACVYSNEQGNNEIEGRTIKTKPVYKIRWGKTVMPGHGQTFLENDLLFSPVRNSRNLSCVSKVFNIGVEEDESYIVEGIVVHNCKHFSRAKGGKPVDKKIRSLAWVVVRWARAVHPRVIILENVSEFETWGPLGPDKKPDPKRKGQTFLAWKGQLERLGYEVEYRTLRACDYGAPTIRQRLFLVARCDGQPIVWPEATHGDPQSIFVLTGALKPWRTAAECIDFTKPCRSIFKRKKALAEATLDRIARGIKKYILESDNPFIVTCNHTGNGFRGQDLDNPFKTVTASRDAHGLVVPVIAKFHGKSPGTACDEPIHTVTAGGTSKRPAGAAHAMGLVAAHVVKYYGTNVGLDARTPLHTATTKDRMGVIETTLSPLVVEIDHRGNGDNGARAAGHPLSTITTENRHSQVSIFLAKHYGGVVGSDVAEPLGTVTSIDHHSLVSVHIQRDFSQSTGSPADTPLGTITAGGSGKAALVASHLVKLKGKNVGQDSSHPLATVTAGGLHHGEVRTTMKKIGEKDIAGQSATDIREFALKYFGTDRLTVDIQGETYMIVDIGLRMLTARELARAQGFPEHYVLNPIVDKVVKTKKGKTRVVRKHLPSSDQIRMIGNSVCPDASRAMVEANYKNAEFSGEGVA